MFHKLDEIDWGKFLIVIAALGIFWTGIMGLTPDKLDKWVFGILGALTGAITYVMNAARR